MILPGCDYLDQDPEELNSIDKIFTSDVDTRKWYARMYSDDFMVQEMMYSGQIPYFWCTDEAAYVMEGNIKNTHLELSIRSVSAATVKTQRNQYGEKYRRGHHNNSQKKNRVYCFSKLPDCSY